MAPVKGKQGTKGAKQIKEENIQTLQFYMYIIVAASVFMVLIQFVYYYSSLRFKNWFLLSFSLLVYVLSMMTMKSMSNSNLDLNMNAGIGENLKDIIILTAACQVLGCLSLYFWLLWLLIPCIAVYKLWVSVLAPWFFAPPPPEMTDKQKKKQEKKQKIRYR